MAIMTVDAYTDGLVNEPEEKYYESGQPFRVEEIFDLGNELIEGATLIGNAVGNFENESISQGLGAVVIVRGIFAPRSLKLSTHSGPKTQLAPPFPGRYQIFKFNEQISQLLHSQIDQLGLEGLSPDLITLWGQMEQIRHHLLGNHAVIVKKALVEV